MKPAIFGGVMSAAMLYMLHDQLMSGDAGGLVPAIGFILLHGLIFLGLAGLMLASPRLRARVLAHRPDARHMGLMLAGGVGTAALIHVMVHGGLA